MKGNINKYGCLFEQKGNCSAKALILLLAFNQAGWEEGGAGVEGEGVGGGTIEMQMLMTVAEDNHCRKCKRVDTVCGSQQRTHEVPPRVAPQFELTARISSDLIQICTNVLRFRAKTHTNTPQERLEGSAAMFGSLQPRCQSSRADFTQESERSADAA